MSGPSRFMHVVIGLSKIPFSPHPRKKFCDQLAGQLSAQGHAVDVSWIPFPAGGNHTLPAEILSAQLISIPGGESGDLLIALDEISALVNHPRKIVWLDGLLTLTKEALGRNVGRVIDPQVAFASSAVLSLFLFRTAGLSASVLYPPVEEGGDREAESEVMTSSGQPERRDPVTFVAKVPDPEGDRLGLMLDAWRLVLEPSILRLVGKREKAERTHGRLLRRFEEEGSVEWWPSREFQVAVEASDILVAVPRMSLEPWPVLYSFSRCRGVVTTYDSGAPAELVRDGREGLVVPARAEDLARALTSIHRDRRLCRRLGEMARGTYLTSVPSWSQAIDTLFTRL